MSDSLRRGLIEKVMNAIGRTDAFGWGDDEPNEATGYAIRSEVEECTEAAVDAMLDYLTDHADEWEVQAALMNRPGYITNEDRLAALRPEIGEP